MQKEGNVVGMVHFQKTIDENPVHLESQCLGVETGGSGTQGQPGPQRESEASLG